MAAETALSGDSSSQAYFSDKSSFWIIRCSAVQGMGWGYTGELLLPGTKDWLEGPGGDPASQDRRWRTRAREASQGSDLRPLGGQHFVDVCGFSSLPISREDGLTVKGTD